MAKESEVKFGDEGFPMKRIPSVSANEVHSNQSSHEPAIENRYGRDEADMARFGKKQQLKRTFGLLSIIGLTCTLMITWEGLLTVFVTDLNNGGSAGLVYGYLFAWAGNILQVLVMAELASMVPLSGGQYNWVAVLAPPQYSKFLSYLTGWTTLIAWQAVVASAAFLGGAMIQGLLTLNYPSYEGKPWQVTLLFYAVLLLTLFINTYLAKLLPKIESMVLVVHVLGFFVILIPLVYLAPNKASAKEVFTTFTNSGGFSSMGLSFFVGMSGAMFAFIGIDAASHVAEEIENAAVVIPRSMTISVILNGALGFGMAIAILFCMGDLTAALETNTGFPFIEIFNQATGSVAGTTAMASLVVAAMILATIGCFVSCSRMTWAFARERGIPGYAHIAKVHEKSQLPLYSIGLTTIISAILALINIGSATAFSALTSLVVAAFYSTFLLAAAVMLHKRLTTPDSQIQYGPFKLGKAGVPVTVGSIAYSIIGVFFSFWPQNIDPAVLAPATMNWSSVVFVGSLLFSLVFWFTHGKHVYTGPIMELSEEEVAAAERRAVALSTE